MDYGDCLPIFISKPISIRYILTIYIHTHLFGIAPCHAPQQARHSHAMAWAIYPLRTSWMLSPCSASRRPEILKSSTHLKFMVSCCCCFRLIVVAVVAALLHVAAGQHFSGFCLCIFSANCCRVYCLSYLWLCSKPARVARLVAVQGQP